MKSVYMVIYWVKINDGNLEGISAFTIYDSLKAAQQNCPPVIKRGAYNWVNLKDKVSIYKCQVLNK